MATTEYEHIERYLQDEMSKTEKADFEKRLKEDSGLQKQLQEYQSISTTLAQLLYPSEKEQSLRQHLTDKREIYFGAEDPKKDQHPYRQRWITIVVAVAAAILTLLIWSPWQHNYLDRYGYIEMTSPVVRGENDRKMEAKAALLFNKESYEEALPLLDSALRTHPADARLLFYRGVAYLHVEKTEEARSDLQEIFKGSSIFKYDAAYYMSFSYLQKKNKTEAKKWLQKIPDDAAIYDKAQQLLEKL